MTSSKASFGIHYVDEVNYCSLIMVRYSISLDQWVNINIMLEYDIIYIEHNKFNTLEKYITTVKVFY